MKKFKEMNDLRELLTSQKTIVWPEEVSLELDDVGLARMAADIAREYGVNDVFLFVFIREGAEQAAVLSIEDEQSYLQEFGGTVVKGLLDYVRKDVY